jgi:hypothetical protein
MEQQQRHMVMQLWHQTAKVKAKAVADYVKELLMNSDPDDKCLVFAYHRWGGLCVEKTPYRIVH